MRPRFDCGRIHDGFHAALFHLDPEKAESLFTKLVVELQSSSLPQDGPIYLAGVQRFWSPSWQLRHATYSKAQIVVSVSCCGQAIHLEAPWRVSSLLRLRQSIRSCLLVSRASTPSACLVSEMSSSVAEWTRSIRINATGSRMLLT